MSNQSGDAVVPLTLFNALLAVAGSVLFLVMTKTSRPKPTIFSIMGVVYFLLFIGMSIGMLFQTNLLAPIDCNIVYWVIGLLPAYTKAIEYAFFILYMQHLFEETALAVDKKTIERMLGLAVYYALSMTILVVLSADRISKTFPNKEVATDHGPPYEVCIFSTQNDFNPDSLITVANHLIVDGIISIFLVYNMITRLLKLHQQRVSGVDRVILAQCIMTCVSAVGTYLLAVVVIFSPQDFGGQTILYFDQVLGLVLISIMLYVYDGTDSLHDGKEWKANGGLGDDIQMLDRQLTHDENEVEMKE